ncbi:MAG: dienelactone hydrolase family protein [Beduini sp.]
MVKKFDLIAEVFDYGEKITKVAIDMGIDIFASTIDIHTFRVTNKSIQPDGKVYFEGECVIENVYVSHSIEGDRSTLGRYVILEMNSSHLNKATDTIFYDRYEDQEGHFDIFKSYNKELKLHFEVEQLKDILIKEVVFMPLTTQYEFARLIRPLADQFSYEVTQTGLNYRQYVPVIKKKKNPLIIWLHGSGEGGTNNNIQILANKGAVAFATTKTQKIFKGAYVIAPQCPDNWIVGSKDYTKELLTLIKEVVSHHHDIDTKKIMLIGCSAGAKMVWKLASTAPSLFSCIVPICGNEIDDEEAKKLKHLPIWMVHSQNDETVSYQYSVKNVQKLKAHKANVTLTSYNRVVREGIEYNGHAVWVYALNNEPVNNEGVSLFEWMASLQKTDPHRHLKIASVSIGAMAIVGLGLLKAKHKKNHD